jgi:tetratricopeptide (TPR) repeat protein
MEEGDLPSARETLTEVVALRRSAGDHAGEAMSLQNLAVVAQRAGDLQAAQGHLENAFRLNKASDNKPELIKNLFQLGRVAHIAKDAKLAETYYTGSMALAFELQDSMSFAAASAQLGRLYADVGDHKRAVERFVIALSHLDANGSPMAALVRQWLLEVRVKVGERSFKKILHEANASESDLKL